MKLRLIHTSEVSSEFFAEIATDHPSSVPGPLALKRDTGEFIAIRDAMGLPGGRYQRYEILEASAEERARFQEAGIMLF